MSKSDEQAPSGMPEVAPRPGRQMTARLEQNKNDIHESQEAASFLPSDALPPTSPPIPDREYS